MSPGAKLAICGFLVGAVTVCVAFVGASADWQYYLTADECLAKAESLVGSRLRVSGKVVPGSLRIASDRRQATFSICGNEGELAVTCAAPLPDQFAENLDVVVEGQLESPRRLKADKVLTRCASKYQPETDSASPGEATRAGLGADR